MYISRYVNLDSSFIGYISYKLKILACIKFLYDCVYVPDVGTSEEKIQPLIDSLNSGYSVLIFPEGKIIHKNEIGEFKKGLSLMAGKTKYPIFMSCISYDNSIFGRFLFGKTLHKKNYESDYTPLFFVKNVTKCSVSL
jgi:1-acyl-sn-glycerol-3-phosphate acyltransferase